MHAVCTYAYDYVPCNDTNHITIASYITYIIASLLLTIITK